MRVLLDCLYFGIVFSLFQKNEMEASYVELQLAHEKQQKMLQMAQVGAPLTHLPTRHLLVQSHQ